MNPRLGLIERRLMDADDRIRRAADRLRRAEQMTRETIMAAAYPAASYVAPQTSNFNVVAANIVGRSAQANLHAALVFFYSNDNVTWTPDASGDIDMGLTDASGNVSTTVLANTNSGGSPAPRAASPYAGQYVGYSLWMEYASGNKFVVTPAGPTPSAPPTYKPLQGVAINPSPILKPWSYGSTYTASGNNRLIWSGGSTFTDDWKTLTLPSAVNPWDGSSMWYGTVTMGPYTVTGTSVFQRYASGGASYYDSTDTPSSLSFEVTYTFTWDGSHPVRVGIKTPYYGIKSGAYYPLSKTAIGGTAPDNAQTNLVANWDCTDTTTAYPATWTGNYGAGTSTTGLFGAQGKTTSTSWAEGTALF